MKLDEMLPMPIEEFVTVLAMPADVYVQLGQDTFVCVCKAGDKATLEQLSAFQKNELKQVWFKKSDYHKMAQLRVAIADFVMHRPGLPVDQRMRFVTAAAKSVFRQFEHIGISVEVFEEANHLTQSTVLLLESEEVPSRVFESLRDLPDELMRHSMAVSFLSAMLGVTMGWEKKLTIEKLALGGLLHDIGLKAIPPEILLKPVAQMTKDERKIYESHVPLGRQMLQNLGGVPDDIIYMMLEHHENAHGTGYPMGVRDLKLHPMAKVLGLADFFVDLTFPSASNPSPKSPAVALYYIENTLGLPFNREVFKALSKIVKNEESKAA